MQNSVHPIPEVIRNASGEALEFTYHPGFAGSNYLMVIAHGVTGNKDRPLLVALAEKLAAAGIHALRFSFAGNGGSEGRFEDCTITKEIQDLDAVLSGLPGWKLGYAGHSMGAAVGVLRAADDVRIRHLISLGGMAHTADFAQREFGEVEPDKGVMWDNPACPLSSRYMEDMRQIGDVLNSARRIQVPWLLVHGLADDVVPPQDSRDLVEVAQGPVQLVELTDADHVFSDAHATVMADVVLDWISTFEKGRQQG